MLIAFLGSITLLPALLQLLRVGGAPAPMGFAVLGGVDRYLASHRRRVLVSASATATVSLVLLPFLRFDFNPLHLRSSESEAVATMIDLARDPRTTPNTIDVLAPSLDAATALAHRLSALPEVSQVLTLASFVPEDQPRKLELIADAALLLEPTLNPAAVEPAPRDDENTRAMLERARALQQAAMHDPANKAAADATRVAAFFKTLPEGTGCNRQALEEAVLPGLRTALAQLRAALQAVPVLLATLPAELAKEWVAPDGRARIEVFPRFAASSERSMQALADENEALRNFVAVVR